MFIQIWTYITYIKVQQYWFGGNSSQFSRTTNNG